MWSRGICKVTTFTSNNFVPQLGSRMETESISQTVLSPGSEEDKFNIINEVTLTHTCTAVLQQTTPCFVLVGFVRMLRTMQNVLAEIQ